MGKLGQVPPQARDVEATILGAMLLERQAVSDVIDVLSVDSFYDERHAFTFKAIVSIFNTGKPVDLVTVVSELRKSGDLKNAGGAAYIAELTTKVNSGANIEVHARIVGEMAMKRQLIAISTNITKKSYDDTCDVFDLYSESELKMSEIMEKNTRGSFVDFKTSLNSTLIEMYEAKDNEFTGIPSGLAGLDKTTNGWQDTDLVIIAARPGMGKTAFVVTCMVNAAKHHNKPVAMFSLEMSTKQLNERIISSEAEIHLSKIKDPKNIHDVEWDRIHEYSKEIENLPIYIDDTPSLNIIELRAKARRMKKKHGIAMIIVDYIQLMSGDKSGNREQEVSAISRALKGLAKELELPVLALSQLSRAVETRGGDKKPILSDLRESGSIEQDADRVIFLYRPEYYGILESEEGFSLVGKGAAIIAKNRHGGLGDIYMKFIGQFTRWQDDADMSTPYSGAPNF